MSKIDEKLGEVIDKLTKLAETHGGQAIEMAVAVARIEAIQTVVFGLIALASSIALWFFFVRKLRAANAERWAEPFPNGVPCLVSGALLIVAVLAAAVHLPNGWAWVGMFEPKLYLAKQIMKAAGL